MNKRLTALLLALILLLSVSCAACGSEAENQTEEAPAASTQDITEATEQLLPTDPAESTSDPNMGEWA